MFRLPLVYLTSPADGFPWAYLREILHGLPQMPNVQNRVKILPKSLTVWVGCTNVTDDRQTTDTINYIADTWPTSKILSLSLRRSLFPLPIRLFTWLFVSYFGLISSPRRPHGFWRAIGLYVKTQKMRFRACPQGCIFLGLKHNLIFRPPFCPHRQFWDPFWLDNFRPKTA